MSTETLNQISDEVKKLAMAALFPSGPSDLGGMGEINDAIRQSQAEAAALKQAKASAIEEVRALLGSAPDFATRQKLLVLLEQVKEANTPAAISNMLASIKSEIEAARSAGDSQGTPEQQTAKLWNEIGQLQDSIKQDMAGLTRLKTDEEKQREREDEENIAKAKAAAAQTHHNLYATAEQKYQADKAVIEASREQAKHQEEVAGRISTDPHATAEQKKTAKNAVEKLHEVQDKLLEVEVKLMEKHSKSPEEIKAMREKIQKENEQERKVWASKGEREIETVIKNTTDNIAQANEQLTKEKTPRLLVAEATTSNLGALPTPTSIPQVAKNQSEPDLPGIG